MAERWWREVEFPARPRDEPDDRCRGSSASSARLVEHRYGKERTERILAACWRLEDLKSAGDLVRMVNEPIS